MNDVELIYEAYEQVISESRPFTLPPGLETLIEDIYTYTLQEYKAYVSEARKFTSLSSFGKERIIMGLGTQHRSAEPHKLAEKQFNVLKHYKLPNPKKRHLTVELYIVQNKHDFEASGEAKYKSNAISLYLPLYGLHTPSLHNTILHELVHLYDPHNEITYLMRRVDFNLNQLKPAEEASLYYTQPGYRAGKIPIEFNPFVAEILDSHSNDELESFLKNLNLNALEKQFHAFIRQMLNNEYLKRKLLEKIYNHIHNT